MLRIVKAGLNKKTIAGGITTLDFKLYYREMGIKTVGSWHKRVTKFNGIESRSQM